MYGYTERLRERDMAAVAQLPDFSPENANTGWGGASAYIKPRMEGGVGGGSLSTADAAAAVGLHKLNFLYINC